LTAAHLRDTFPVKQLLSKLILPLILSHLISSHHGQQQTSRLLYPGIHISIYIPTRIRIRTRIRLYKSLHPS
jgi:hypothetical protein